MGRRFLGAVGISCAALLVLGWFTGMRDTMHGTLIALGTVALFPFLVIAAILAIIVLGAIVVGAAGDAPDVGGDLHGGEGEGLIVGFALIPRYYRFLARQTNATTAGIAAGLTLGALVLWAVIALVIVPGELKTLDAMKGWKQAIDQQRQTNGAFPETLAENDAFGRPVQYAATQGLLGSYRIRSLGFDGVESKDDLCLSGSTKAGAVADALAFVLSGLTAETKLDQRLAGLRSLRCE